MARRARYWIEVAGTRRYFRTLQAALRAATRIFAQTGTAVGIQKEAR